MFIVKTPSNVKKLIAAGRQGIDRVRIEMANTALDNQSNVLRAPNVLTGHWLAGLGQAQKAAIRGSIG